MSRACRRQDSFPNLSVASDRMDRSDGQQILARKQGFLCEIQIKVTSFCSVYSWKAVRLLRCSTPRY